MAFFLQKTSLEKVKYWFLDVGLYDKSENDFFLKVEIKSQNVTSFAEYPQNPSAIFRAALESFQKSRNIYDVTGLTFFPNRAHVGLKRERAHY